MLFVLVVLASLALARIYFILPQSHRQRAKSRRKDETCSLAVFLGSGVSHSMS